MPDVRTTRPSRTHATSPHPCRLPANSGASYRSGQPSVSTMTNQPTFRIDRGQHAFSCANPSPGRSRTP
jgi:hypothetical protein